MVGVAGILTDFQPSISVKKHVVSKITVVASVQTILLIIHEIRQWCVWPST